uniref:Uncharacterized protein n=1 Tax=Mustela putorius furo TaxID=9669 RepID=M3YV03_MUSPF
MCLRRMAWRLPPPHSAAEERERERARTAQPGGRSRGRKRSRLSTERKPTVLAPSHDPRIMILAKCRPLTY